MYLRFGEIFSGHVTASLLLSESDRESILESWSDMVKLGV